MRLDSGRHRPARRLAGELNVPCLQLLGQGQGTGRAGFALAAAGNVAVSVVPAGFSAVAAEM
jgi:hypothetical protein